MTNVIAVGLLSAGIALSAFTQQPPDVNGEWSVQTESAAQSGLAGKWTGTEQGRGNVTYPVTLELVVNGEEATGTVSIGDDPVKALANGKVQGTTVTFTTPGMMNGREIAITWRGELKDDRLTFTRRLAGGPEMSPLSLQRAAS